MTSLLSCFVYLILIWLTNNMLSRNYLFICSTIIILTQCVMKYNQISLMYTNATIYDLLLNKVSLLWSMNEYGLFVYLFLFFFISLFLSFYHKHSPQYTLFSTGFLYKLLMLFCVVCYNFICFVPGILVSHASFNIILDNPLVSIHPPLILISIFLIRFIIYSLLNSYSFIIDQRNFLLPLMYYLYYLLTIAILLGSIWSTTLFGWGGWWIWDPIENIAFFYWAFLLLFFHTKLSYQLFLIIQLSCFVFDVLFFCFFKLSLLNSLHIFKNNIAFVSSNYFNFIFYLILYSCILLLLVIVIHSFKFLYVTYVWYIILLLCFLFCYKYLAFFNVNIPNTILNICFYFIMFVLVLEYIKYFSNFNYVFSFAFYVGTVISFTSPSFFFLLSSLLLIYTIYSNKYHLVFLSNHLIFIICILLFYLLQLYEFNILVNYTDAISLPYYTNYFYNFSVNSEFSTIRIVYFIKSIGFHTTSFFEYPIHNYSITSHYLSTFTNSIQDRNEFFLLFTDFLNVFIRFDFSTLKLCILIHFMYIVFGGIIFILIQLFLFCCYRQLFYVRL